MKKLKPPTKTKFARQTIGIATQVRPGNIINYFRVKNSVYLTLISIIGLSSLFSHLWVIDPYTPGWFGFKYMTSFLFALGVPVSVVCLSLVIKFAASKIENEYNSVINLISNLGLYVGLFYALYTFIPMVDFERYVYYLAFAVVALGLLFVAVWVNRAVMATEEKLKTKIRLLIGFVLKTRNEYFMPVAVKAVAAEKARPPLDGVFIEKQIGDFDIEMWNTLEQVSND